ncbi:calcium-binding protein [Conexibacter sp. JD483]|uniref:calcium-binding protein n=1 Tax=unclassified Conexibacter TaxID=2627773 RepID=UPI0027156A79|nr:MULTISPECIES: calcium-binding protein [unclassified Conexibacter]MDO8186119.1 calcium-binding protein [Conexibacter sp. CPCC 205706]MDO8199609.1 calcium-binding protein [Conexibacter sp. CPCC 205762]MDR9369137.1 calcium-binding protein [Conexibacter sp. JD483]
MLHPAFRAARRAALPCALLLLSPLASTSPADGRPRVTERADVVRLGAGDDRLRARGGDDRVWGGAGDDRLWGGPGNDQLWGGAGNDRLVGGGGRDRLRGGAGNDVLDARDGRRDLVVDGGRGRDLCLVDAADRAVVRNCETIRVSGRGPSTPAPPAAQQPSAPPAGPAPPDAGPADPPGDGLPGTPGEPEPEPADDGLPAPLPDVPRAAAAADWTPAAQDSCPRAVHDRFAVIGADGKRYPTWHPPTVIDPATGLRCSFGHEHGRDPRGSELFDWVSGHLAAEGRRAYAGLPFGVVNESLEAYATANPGVATRREDHVGNKIDYQNNVRLDDVGGTPIKDADGRSVTCDVLFKLHQGSHSADAIGNNVHELIYAVRCTDGTELITQTLARFGNPNEYQRACGSAATRPLLSAGTAHPYPGGAGGRSIPDRQCVVDDLLVRAGRSSTFGAVYETWRSQNELRDSGGRRIAAFDADFAIWNPSRYAYPGEGGRIGRTVDACWEVEENGDRFQGYPCDDATLLGQLAPFPWDDLRSPYKGDWREFFVRDSTVENADGPTRWFTDPYGGNGSATAFPGALCQLVSRTDNSDRPELKQKVFGRDRRGLPADQRVHAPN